MELQIECSYNKKTGRISHGHFQTCDYLTSLPPKQSKLAKMGMLHVKADFKNKYANVLKCPMYLGSSETFSHIFICPFGLWFQKVLERYLEARKLLM